MADTTRPDIPPLDYAAPPPARSADRRRMFLYLLPAAICVGAIIGSVMIEAAFPNGDSRNFSGPACALVMAPLALIFGIMAVCEAFRPGGLRALRWGLGWNALAAFGPWVVLWIIVKFGLLKHP